MLRGISLWGVVCLSSCLAGGAPYRIEPDDYPDKTVLDTIHPMVVLSVLDESGTEVPLWDVTANVDSVGLAPTGTSVFGHANVQFWDSTRQLRMVFAEPMSWVSIDFAGGTFFSTEIGRLKIYDAADNLLDTYVTQPLGAGEVETMLLSRAEEDIAYAIGTIAPGEGSFGRLDNLAFVPEPASAALLALGALGVLRGRKR